jgi:hydroxymethylpyrimidine/phosphomethylpyrimidine kinase
MRAAGTDLAQEFATQFLIKGGHLGGERAIDLLCAGTQVQEFSAPFVGGVSTHGTGCTYSAAIAAHLACGDSLETAVARGKEFVSRAIAEHLTWNNIHALNQSCNRRR